MTSFAFKIADESWWLEVSAYVSRTTAVRICALKKDPVELSMPPPERVFGSYDFFARDDEFATQVLSTLQKNNWIQDTGRVVFGKQGEKIRIFEVCHPELQTLVDLGRL